MAFMSGEEPVHGAFRNIGISAAEADRYYTEVENGGILLYVDREYGGLYRDGRTAAVGDPNLGGKHMQKMIDLTVLFKKKKAFSCMKSG